MGSSSSWRFFFFFSSNVFILYFIKTVGIVLNIIFPGKITPGGVKIKHNIQCSQYSGNLSLLNHVTLRFKYEDIPSHTFASSNIKNKENSSIRKTLNASFDSLLLYCRECNTIPCAGSGFNQRQKQKLRLYYYYITTLYNILELLLSCTSTFFP